MNNLLLFIIINGYNVERWHNMSIFSKLSIILYCACIYVALMFVIIEMYRTSDSVFEKITEICLGMCFSIFALYLLVNSIIYW